MSPFAAGAPRLRPELANRVALVARLAAAQGIEAYLVGGTVRDLLTGRDSADLDFTVVGDSVALAGGVQRELGGRLVRHPAFLTADVIDAEGFHLDLATARQETYRTLAALPDVSPAGIEADLARRDFTVNAMALRLAPLGPLAPTAGSGDGGGGVGDAGGSGVPDPFGGAILDPFGGRRDLAAGVLRVLHERSFLDDPTRVLRGARLAARLGLRFAAATADLARQAVAAGAFAQLGGSRLRHELELLLAAEPMPAMALLGLEQLADLGVLGAIHPRLDLDAPPAGRKMAAPTGGEDRQPAGGVRRRLQRSERLQDAGLEHAWYAAAGSPAPRVRPWLLMLMALLGGLGAADRQAAADRLALVGEEGRLVSASALTDGGLAALALRLGGVTRPSEAEAALAPLSGEELLLLAAQGGALARSWVRRYWLELRPLACAIGGGDLLAAGAPQGPEIGQVLRATRAARLDGEIGPSDELAFALDRLRGAHHGRLRREEP